VILFSDSEVYLTTEERTYEVTTLHTDGARCASIHALCHIVVYKDILQSGRLELIAPTSAYLLSGVLRGRNIHRR
jgi:hypothetical protein